MRTKKTNKNNKDHRRNFADIVLKLLITAAATAVIVFWTLFFRERREYRIAEEEYASLRQYMTVTDEGTGAGVDGAGASIEEAGTDAQGEGSTEGGNALSGEGSAAGSEDGNFSEEAAVPVPTLTIDFGHLQEINPDFAGVLYVPALDLLYPVAQSRENNTDYLRKTFEGNANATGSIFLDSVASPDYTDANTFLFGHNMKNGTMFGSLKKFAADPALAPSDPYVYLYLPDRVLQYEIFAYYVTKVGSRTYEDFTDDEGRSDYLAYVMQQSAYDPPYLVMPGETEEGTAPAAGDQSVFDPGDKVSSDAGAGQTPIDFSKGQNLLVLSTCSGTEHTNRFVVHCALVGIERTN